MKTEYKPKINPLNSTLIQTPVLRFKHLKQKVGDKQWSHYERHHWKLQVAYSVNKKSGEYEWYNIQDQYFYDDGNGNEQEITLKEYRSDVIKK
jgi:hypothetical protein